LADFAGDWPAQGFRAAAFALGRGSRRFFQARAGAGINTIPLYC
jgi:hypothetical protein